MRARAVTLTWAVAALLFGCSSTSTTEVGANNGGSDAGGSGDGGAAGDASTAAGGRGGASKGGSSAKGTKTAQGGATAPSTSSGGQTSPSGGSTGTATSTGTVAVCTPNDVRCVGQTPELCNSAGSWVPQAACANQACVGGQCVGTCSPSAGSCGAGNVPRTCNAQGTWVDGAACAGQTCVLGVCQGVCGPAQSSCLGNTPRTCSATGAWQLGSTCPESTPVCSGGLCQNGGISCSSLAANCGSAANQNCCAAAVVTGGVTFNRNNDTALPATISGYKLDDFEITIGRFRKFVEAGYGTQANPPITNTGAHPSIAGSGWTAGWNASLVVDKATLYTELTKANGVVDANCKWTNAAGSSENLPINCISWLEAFAFCLWDGGFLPSEAEWSYAAMGGTNYWSYPWGTTAPTSTYAVYANPGSPAIVGSKPAGIGRYGQFDLAGNVWEWTLDAYTTTPPVPCTDCAYLDQVATGRGIRGGGWTSAATTLITYNPSPYNYPFTFRTYGVGARCARPL